MLGTAAAFLVGACVVGQVSAQTFQRLGGCPKLGCVFPPDHTDFLSGQFFDIRVEVHAPVNGSEAAHGGVADEKFTFCIQHGKGECQSAAKFFSIKEPTLEKWTFSCVYCSISGVMIYLRPSSSDILRTCLRRTLAPPLWSMSRPKHIVEYASSYLLYLGPDILVRSSPSLPRENILLG